MTRDMKTAWKIFRASSSVEGLPCVAATSGSFFHENNRRVPGWTKYHRGRHRQNARALAISTWTIAPRVHVIPMGY
eukprot:7447286-Pyramimonas_sp.AAC.2